VAALIVCDQPETAAREPLPSTAAAPVLFNYSPLSCTRPANPRGPGDPPSRRR
jgi:hypothetical protein